MSKIQNKSETIEQLRARLEAELSLCDALGLSAVAIDLNQALEKLKAHTPRT